METFVEKFDPHELSVKLIPGIILTGLFSLSLSFHFYSVWNSWGVEKYFLYFAVSYLIGLLFGEWSALSDKVLRRLLYKGRPRQVFLATGNMIMDYGKVKNGSALKDARNMADDIARRFNISIKPEKWDKWTLEQLTDAQRNTSALIYAYCINELEVHNLDGKINKMLINAEMSTSLFWGCLMCILLNIGLTSYYDTHIEFYTVESILLLAACGLLISRKIRFERFRVEIAVRFHRLLRDKIKNQPEKEKS